MFHQHVRARLAFNIRFLRSNNARVPIAAPVLQVKQREFWNKGSKATDTTKKVNQVEEDSGDVLTSALLRSSRTHEGVREKLQQERRRLLEPTAVDGATSKSATSQSKVNHVDESKTGKTAFNSSTTVAYPSSTQPSHLSPLGLLRDDGPDKMESHKLDMDRELVRAYLKRQQEDDKKRRETDDGFWMGRSFPRSTVWTLWLSLGGNVAIALAKFYAYTRTGHSAMFSEAVHTLVDVGNQVVLAYGLREASRAPDSRHQYGYGRAAFFYSLLSALSTFGFGAVYTFVQGLDMLHSPPAHQLETLPETWAVLGVAFAVDGFVLTTAMRNVTRRANKQGITFWQWLVAFRDPFTVAVIFEDSAAVVGVVIATVGIGLTQYTGSPVWDGVASLMISALLAGVSLRLVQLNRSFILGKPIDPDVKRGIRSILLRRRSVDAVYAEQSQWVGPSAFAYNAEVDFDGTYLAAQVYARYEQEIARSTENGTLQHDLMWLLPCFAEDVTRVLEKEVRAIEAEVRSAYKDAAFIEIVPDSSQTTSAIEGMSSVSRRAEHDILLSLINTMPGERDTESHWAFYKLGVAYQAMGQHEKAVGPLLSCVAAREQLWGHNHPEVAIALGRVAESYASLGNMDKARKHLERAIPIFGQAEQALFGMAHTAALESLAAINEKGGSIAKTIELLEQAYEVAQASGGADKKRLADLLYKQGIAKSRLRNATHDALALLQRAKTAYEALPHTTAEVAHVLKDIGRVHKAAYELSQAAAAHQERLLLLEQKYGPDSIDITDCLVDLADALSGQCIRPASETALNHLERALVIRQRQLPEHHYDIMHVKNCLISIRTSLGLPLPPDLFT
eukprot:m.1639860 g.1639860  ORF g.1639860 m.1639860 type:complete len:847 (+) comp38395_c0_seq1:287-2827(+)